MRFAAAAGIFCVAASTTSFAQKPGEAEATMRNGTPKLATELQDVTIDAGEELRIQVKAADPDGDHVSFKRLKAPREVKIEQTGPTSAVIVWQTDPISNGTHPVHFLISDGKSMKTYRFHVTIRRR